MPALPVPLKSLVRNSLIVPPVAIPIMVLIVPSPAWVYIIVETRNMAIIDPSPVIIMRPIPTTFPRTPPPTVPEEQINVYIRSNVNAARIRECYHCRRCSKCDVWRQGNMNPNFHPCHGRNRCANQKRKEQCSQKHLLHFSFPLLEDILLLSKFGKESHLLSAEFIPFIPLVALDSREVTEKAF